MSEFNFTHSKQAYEKRFFQFPQVLLFGEQYKDLSDSAKLGYMVLQDRFDYSLRNHWIDDQDRVYFIFTNEELHKLFGWSDRKTIRVKQELEEAGLLFQIKQGFDPKKKRNLPNKLYLAELEVTATDVYTKDKFSNQTAESLATSGSAKMQVRQETEKTAESLATSGSAKMQVRQEMAKPLATSGSAKMQVNQDNTNYLDTNRYNIDTQKLDFSTAHFSPVEIERQNRDLVMHANDFLTDETSGWPVFLEPEAVQLVSLWCHTPAEMRHFIGIILNAKYAVEKEHQDLGVHIALDEPELKTLMTKALRRYFNALRSNEKQVRNFDNYLFGTMQNLFAIWWNKQAMKQYHADHPDDRATEENPSWQ